MFFGKAALRELIYTVVVFEPTNMMQIYIYIYIPLKTDLDPESRKAVFQGAILRVHLSFRGCVYNTI